ncbi:MAG: Gfo/Idh/MocA family oxidoreductase [Ruminococcaceae bacterium]|nr:Gfo/Idh/MocA family oxidoreductase [Oscillospiraceae bacterium]
MRKIRVIQYGTWVCTHADHVALCMRSMPDIYELVGVCEPNDEYRARAESAEAYKGVRWMTLDEVLNEKDIDAIIVETHELEQGKDALFFVQRGYNVHMDKPGGEDKKIFEELVKTAKEKNVIFQTGYMYRYNPAILKTLDIIKSGLLGDIIFSEMHMSAWYSKFLVDWLGEFKGGMMFYLGCHLTDLMYLLQGKPNKIEVLNTSSGLHQSSSKDSGFVLFHYDRGVSFAKTVACETDGYKRRQLVVVGTNGVIEIKPIEDPTVHETITNANVSTLQLRYRENNSVIEQQFTFEPYGRYDDMMIDFARMVSGEKENPFSPDYELEVYKLIRKTCELED